MASPFCTFDKFDQGITWEEYLEAAAASELQRRRYLETPDEKILDAFRGISSTRYGVMLCQFGCGDCAFSVPRILRLLDEMPDCEVRLFPKEAHPDLMDKLETNGKRSVPKLALLDENMELLATWGPRPAPIQQFVQESVAAGKKPPEWKPTVLKYYRNEGVRDLYHELVSLVK